MKYIKYIGHKFCVLLITCYFLGLACCKQNNSEQEVPSNIVDSAVINVDDIFRVSITKMQNHNNNDSIISIISWNDSKVYYLDSNLNIIKTIDYKFSFGEVGEVCYANSIQKFIAINYESKLFFIEKEWESISLGIELSNSDLINYMPYSNLSFNDKDSTILIIKIPYLNTNIKEEFDKYFSSHIVAKIKIDENVIHEEEIKEINFPNIYKSNFYNDFLAIYESDMNENIYYTFHQWDSIGILNKDKILKTIPIPSQYLIDTIPMTENQKNSFTETKEYSAKISSNANILNTEKYLLLFQKLKIDNIENEDGTMNDYLSSKMRLILFNKDKKEFEDQYYILPERSHPFKSIIFQDHLIILAQGEDYGKIKLYKIAI